VRLPRKKRTLSSARVSAKTCGSVTAADNCGTQRTVANCGALQRHADVLWLQHVRMPGELHRRELLDPRFEGLGPSTGLGGGALGVSSDGTIVAGTAYTPTMTAPLPLMAEA